MNCWTFGFICETFIWMHRCNPFSRSVHHHIHASNVKKNYAKISSISKLPFDRWFYHLFNKCKKSKTWTSEKNPLTLPLLLLLLLVFLFLVCMRKWLNCEKKIRNKCWNKWQIESLRNKTRSTANHFWN